MTVANLMPWFDTEKSDHEIENHDAGTSGSGHAVLAQLLRSRPFYAGRLSGVRPSRPSHGDKILLVADTYPLAFRLFEGADVCSGSRRRRLIAQKQLLVERWVRRGVVFGVKEHVPRVLPPSAQSGIDVPSFPSDSLVSELVAVAPHIIGLSAVQSAEGWVARRSPELIEQVKELLLRTLRGVLARRAIALAMVGEESETLIVNGGITSRIQLMLIESLGIEPAQCSAFMNLLATEILEAPDRSIHGTWGHVEVRPIERAASLISRAIVQSESTRARTPARVRSA